MQTICDDKITIVKIDKGLCRLTITDYNYDYIWQKKVDGQWVLHTKAVINDEKTLTIEGIVVDFLGCCREDRFHTKTTFSHFLIEHC